MRKTAETRGGFSEQIVGMFREFFAKLTKPVVEVLKPYRDNFFVGNLPNFLSVARLVLSGLIAYRLFLAPTLTERVVYLAIVAILILSDGLDGALARGLEKISQFGSLIDPLGDKVLIGGLAVGLAFRLNWLPFTLAVILLLVIEFLNMLHGYRGSSLAKKLGKIAGAGTWGKLKFGAECVMVFIGWLIPSNSIALPFCAIMIVVAIPLASMSLRSYLSMIRKNRLLLSMS